MFESSQQNKSVARGNFTKVIRLCQKAYLRYKAIVTKVIRPNQAENSLVK